jgi:hypothetical protein
VDNAVYEGPFVVTPGNLVTGTNLLAVEVHQVNNTSSDVVFGASVEALVLPSQALAPPVLRASWNGSILWLQWDPPGSLEVADSPLGPWVPGGGQAGEALIEATGTQRYFRVSR